MMEEKKIKEPIHCDEYVWGLKSMDTPECLFWFLFVNRQSATLIYRLVKKIGEPVLFADYKNKRVRVVMASRLGDVGITEDLKSGQGYVERVSVESLSGFSEKP